MSYSIFYFRDFGTLKEIQLLFGVFCNPFERLSRVLKREPYRRLITVTIFLSVTQLRTKTDRSKKSRSKDKKSTTAAIDYYAKTQPYNIGNVK